MTDPVADPSDVRLEYDTVLDDKKVNKYLYRAVTEIQRYVDLGGMNTDDRTVLEAAMAAYLIATRSADRAEDTVSSGRTSVGYETGVVDEIEATISEYDPSGKLPKDSQPGGSLEVY